MTDGGETIGSAHLAGLTLADGLRWTAATVLVAGLALAGVTLARHWTPMVNAPAAADPVILLDLAPAPPPEPVPEPVPAPAPEAVAPPPALPEPAVADVPETVPETAPELEDATAAPIAPTPPEETSTAETAPTADPPAMPPAPEPPAAPAVAPAEVTPQPLAMPLPATMSAALGAQRARTPATTRARPAAPLRQQATPARPSPPPSPPPATAAAAPGPSPAQWQSQVLRQLDRSKVYPRAAQRSGQEGVVQIGFTVDAAGRLSGIRVTGSSGIAELDQAAVDTARRASPVPRPPAAMGQGNLSLTAAIRFALR